MLVLHTNKHKCPHLVPSVGCPFASAVALIRFHSFLPSSYCWMYLWKSEMGMKDNLCRVFSCGRQTADLSLTSYSSPARLLSASSFAAWTWQIRDLSVTAFYESCAFFFCLKENEKKMSSAVYLPYEPSLPISVFFSSSVSMFLQLFEVFDSREPREPVQPLEPWVKADQTNMPFCALSFKDKDTPPISEEAFLGAWCSDHFNDI